MNLTEADYLVAKLSGSLQEYVCCPSSKHENLHGWQKVFLKRSNPDFIKCCMPEFVFRDENYQEWKDRLTKEQE